MAWRDHSVSVREWIANGRRPVLLRLAHVDLQFVLPVDHERRVQRQLVECREVGDLAGVERELDQRGAGQEHSSVDGVVGEPRMRLE